MTFTPLSLRRPLAVALAGLMLTTAALAEKPEGAGGGNGQGKSEQRGQGKSEERMNQSQSSPAERQGRPEKSGRPDKGQQAKQQGAPVTVNPGSYFGDSQRAAVRTYYGNQYSAGRCPPGLAKKNNGCMPPGQARKWAVGQQLPSNVVFYSVPQSVLIQLGAPPPSHKYVRVAADILLIAVGTNMVVDAIQDLGRL
jgi:Ni/Co efflux regulator RcnB